MNQEQIDADFHWWFEVINTVGEDCQEEQSQPRNGCYAEEDEVIDQLMKSQLLSQQAKPVSGDSRNCSVCDNNLRPLIQEDPVRPRLGVADQDGTASAGTNTRLDPAREMG